MAQVAVVTGASGFIATQVVKQLLEKGYEVRATVRSAAAKDKVQALLDLGEAFPGTVTLYEADLLKEGSFDAAVKGADFVFHTASPFIREVHDPQKDLVDPAVKGTRNVLSSVAKNLGTVKTVVLTSSFASVVKPKKGPANGKLYTEDDWNDESTLTDGSYRYSKVTAERAAWEMSKEHGFQLRVINPTFVLGPVIGTRADATSILDFKDFIEGTRTEIMPWICDVRDIARAHVLAAEHPDAEGRYLVSNASTIGTSVISEALSKAMPQYRFPTPQPTESKEVIDNSKVQKQLGLKLTPPVETFVDMAVTLIQTGIAKPVPK